MTRLTILSIALATLGAGCDSMLVGGICLDGYVEQAGACVLDPDADGGGTAQGGDAPAGGAGQGGEAQGGGGQGAGGGTGGADCGTLTPCGAACVDLGNDPNNCGECGLGCLSGACDESVCVGDPAGHVVAVGAPAGGGLGSSQSMEMLTNAVLISPRQPVRVLVLRAHDSAPVSLISLEQRLSSAATSRGRQLQIEHLSGASPGAIQQRLDASAVDVLLVPAHSMGSESVTAASAALLAGSLTSFCGNGGIVIALDTATRPGSASSILDASGLLAGLQTVEVESDYLHVADWTDALAIGVVSPFASASQTVGFAVPQESDAVVVLRGEDDTPVVVHRAILASGD